ncbi:MAG: DUF6495 family protein [Bacteroidota bacterium]
MKYRRLRPDELTELEPQFVRFLASNTVTADDWQKLKTENREKAERLIDLFSDLVFAQTIEKIQFLQRRSPREIQCFACLPDKIQLRGLRVEGESPLDFTRNDSPSQMLEQLAQSGAELQLYRAEKAYQPSRDRELFTMLESGCLIANGDVYRTLDGLKS